MNCRVALIQNIITENRQENVDKAIAGINYSAANGADIVILPEMFCCPYDKKHITESAEDKDGNIIKALSDAAVKNHVYIIGGSIPELSSDKRIFNTSFIFNRNGEIIARHRKSHLYDVYIPGKIKCMESDIVSCGNDITVFDTEFGKIGVCICYDIRFPEMIRLMADRRAVMVIVPAVFNTTTGPVHWELLFRSRAIDNQIYTIGAAPAENKNSEYVSYGHSIIVSPWGEVIAQMDEKEGICIKTINLDRVNEVRQMLPLLQHRNNKLYELKNLND